MPARAVTLLALSLCAASPARAQEVRSVRLAWERARGAEGCADGDAVRRGVEARLGREVFVDFGEEADARVRGRVAPAERGFVATLELDNGDGPPRVRTVPTALDDCRALDRTVVLLVSMFIDPETPLTDEERESPQLLSDPSAAEAGTDTGGGGGASAEAPASGAGSPADGDPAQTQTSEGSDRTSDQEAPGSAAGDAWAVRIWIGGAGWVGPAPTVTGGPQLGVAVVPPDGVPSFELGLAYGVASEASQGGARVAVSLGLATLGVCPRLYGDALFAFDACGDVQAGVLVAEASGPPDAVTEVRPWLALGARLRAVLRFSPGFAALGLGAHVPLWRDRFGLTSPGGFVTVHEPFVLSGVTELTLGLRL